MDVSGQSRRSARARTETVRTIYDDYQCDECHGWFSLMLAEVGWCPAVNTLTPMKDINRPWVKCPHCGFVNTSEELVIQ